MRTLYLFLVFSFVSVCASAQIFSCPTCAGSAPTSYTNGQPNDSIFFVCAGSSADLVATGPPSSAGLYNYTWQYFNPFTNTWAFFYTSSIVFSPQSFPGAGPGGYRVIITDALSGTFLGSDVAWVSQVDTPTSVDVAPIPPGCGGSLSLTGLVNLGSVTPYYNAPVDLSSPVIVGPSTSISMCISGTHTFNSDLTFTLVGPASCGSPTAVLSPYSSSMGQAINCNGLDNFSNLCFTNQSTTSFNICGAGGNMTGNYGAYGLGAGTPINWSAFNGCDATQGPWTLRVQDCYTTDFGTILPTTTLTITGANGLGVPTTITFSPATITPIADGACAQTFGFNPACCTTSNVPLNLPVSTLTPLPMNVNYTWTANPVGPIITVASGVVPASGIITATVPAPTQDTQFTLTLSGMQANANCGGNSSDTELYDNQASTPVTIPNPGALCATASAVTLVPSIPGGTFSGTGVNAAGVFSPTAAGVGSWTVNYSTGGACPSTGSTIIQVQAAAPSIITAPTTLCSDASAVTLTANNAGGTWTGTGVNPAGLFTPSGAVGSQTITYTPLAGQCYAPATTNIQVIQTPTVTITDVAPVCSTSASFTLVSSLAGVTWSGTGVNPATGVFTPTAAGAFAITASATGSCAASDNTIVNVVSPAAITLSGPAQVCVSSGPVNYLSNQVGGVWSGLPAVSAAGAFSPNVAGVGGPYNLVYTMSDVCMSSQTISVEVLEQLYVSINDNFSQLCSNGSPIVLTANIPGGSWSGVGVNPTTGSFNPNLSGAGDISIIYSIGGLCPNSDYTTVTVVGAPAVNITQATPFCLNSLNTTLTASPTGGTWAGTGILDPLTGSFSPSAAGVGTTPITYTYTSAPCTVTSTSNVVVNPLPIVFAGTDAIICSGASTGLQANGASTYQWSINGGAAVGLNNPSISNPQASPTATTVYSVLGVDANGCTSVDQVQVSVNPLPTINAGSNVSICPGIPSTLGASGASTYAWTPSTGLTGANTATPAANPASTQTYTVTGTDANGCQNTDQVTVTVFSQPVVTASSTSPIIECQTAQLTATGLVSYNWVNAAGADASISTPNASTTDVGPLANATYAVAGLDSNGCAGGATVSVVVNPITVSIVNATTINPSTFSFDITSNASNFDWDFYTDGISDASTTNTSIQNTYATSPTPPLDYIVTTVMASIGNCEAQDTIHVFIDNTLLDWPNIVIADGDGRNDVLSFLSQDPTLQPNWQSITTIPTITNFKVEIFNRWGKKVGEVNDPTGSWDPKEFGAGVYFYVVTYTKRSTGMSAEEIEVKQAVEVFVK